MKKQNKLLKKNINKIWKQVGNNINQENSNDVHGHSISLSSDGKIVAIGAIQNDGNGTDSGHVRVYQYSDNSDIWTQMGKDIEGEAFFDSSGWAVSLSSDGNIVAIGSPNNSVNGFNQGVVRVYQYFANSNKWTKLGQDIYGEAEYDFSGKSLSLNFDGSIIAIGAGNNDGNDFDSGHTRVFKYSTPGFINGKWEQIGQDIDGVNANDNSGTSVSLSSEGNIVAIGAPWNNNSADSSGQV